MRVFVTRTFRRFQRREQIDDAALVEAVERIAKGLIDADLGGGLIKQCVARPGQGRSRGFRTIIAYRSSNRAVFLFGFAKSALANLPPRELSTLRIIGPRVLQATEAQLAEAVLAGELMEIEND